MRALDAYIVILGSFRADMYSWSQDFIGNSEQQQTSSVANVALEICNSSAFDLMSLSDS